MFETATPPTQPPMQNPLNPVMPAPGAPTAQVPTSAPAPFAPPQAPVHTMPERFRAAGPAPTGPKGSGRTKKLLMILIIVVVVAGLGVAGLYIFNKTVKNSNTNNTANMNTTNTTTNTSTNLNLNLNTNTADLNANTTITNQGANTNTANVNSTANTNVVTNSTTNTNGATNTNTTVSVTKLPSSADTDSDGLTNVEEAVYGTDVANPDSDGDTFIDGYQVRADGTVVGELGNLYNPKGTGQLEGSSLVKRVQNSGKTYSLLMPANWTTNESSGLLLITPTQSTGEFFQVRTYDNATNQTPTQWYQANNPQAQMSLVTTSAVNGLETLTSEDGSTVYFFSTKDAKVYGLTYTNGGLTQLNYWTTMYMMMKSFKLVAS